MKKIIIGVMVIIILLVTLTGCTDPAVCGNNRVESGEGCDNSQCPSGSICENCRCNSLPQPPALPEE
ncbi:hypothetical protein HN419_07020 [Candidatus Woesearchaeota archaeon]|jgi:hypothetical protein|nr:hypothetical protein [Candidatus Woesearchaeota archaeon]MBT3538243.1 hypothetical protein [Candidatus Woesearchaeota archaeon]MBT4697697.1 hypothetical protein [Candidatus Woesearchaeota archaeon]MBT4717409.1 hypothetical protein [Candidatus Woesearchaeota archaeon]MBT7105912.1 hypothetical protein [Candidatus Woesearchaeota archaeon]